MKKFIIGTVISLIVIMAGSVILKGKIKIFGTNVSNTETSTAPTTSTVLTISEQKSEEQKGKVLYTLSTPEITNAPILQKNIYDYVDGFKKSIAKDAEEISFEGASSDYSLNISYEIIRNDQKVTVIRMSAYEYTGGAHGNPSFAFFMYDTRAKRMISEDEIFVNKKNSALIAIIADALIKKPEYSFEDGGTKKSMFFDLDENKQTFLANMSAGGNIAIAQNGVLFKYGSYAIGPYVIGEPEVEIPFVEIEMFLTPYAQTFFK